MNVGRHDSIGLSHDDTSVFDQTEDQAVKNIWESNRDGQSATLAYLKRLDGGFAEGLRSRRAVEGQVTWLHSGILHSAGRCGEAGEVKGQQHEDKTHKPQRTVQYYLSRRCTADIQTTATQSTRAHEQADSDENTKVQRSQQAARS